MRDGIENRGRNEKGWGRGGGGYTAYDYYRPRAYI